MRRAALGAGPALALGHDLYPGDRDRVALRDEVLGRRAASYLRPEPFTHRSGYERVPSSPVACPQRRRYV